MSGQDSKKLKRLTPKKSVSAANSNAVRILYVEDAGRFIRQRIFRHERDHAATGKKSDGQET